MAARIHLTERAWYLTGGLRTGSVTPYASVGQSRRDYGSEGAGLDLSRLPPDARPGAAALNSMLDGFVRPNDFDTFTVGLRWDFRRNVDLKLQVDHFRLEDRSQGRLANV